MCDANATPGIPSHGGMPVRTRTIYNQDSMKKRLLYAILFGVPGFLISGIFTLFILGASMGVLWLFIFGDDPWPSSVDIVLPIILVLIFVLLWVGLIAFGYHIGKRLEANPTVNGNHVLISVGLTTLFLLFIVLQQWSVGNLGPKSDSVLCSDYCVSRGYAGSGMPPRDSGDRTCSCYDSSGKEAVKIPLDEIDLDVSK